MLAPPMGQVIQPELSKQDFSQDSGTQPRFALRGLSNVLAQQPNNTRASYQCIVFFSFFPVGENLSLFFRTVSHSSTKTP